MNAPVQNMPIYQALAHAFQAEGVDHQFTLMGDGNMHWSTAMKNLPGVTTTHARHEHCATMMAAGYYLATGKVGVASVTCGQRTGGSSRRSCRQAQSRSRPTPAAGPHTAGVWISRRRLTHGSRTTVRATSRAVSSASRFKGVPRLRRAFSLHPMVR